MAGRSAALAAPASHVLHTRLPQSPPTAPPPSPTTTHHPPQDIERCYEAVRHAPKHRIHTFLASSDIHLEHKLGISRAKCVEIASTMVAFAKTMVTALLHCYSIKLSDCTMRRDRLDDGRLR